MRFYKIVSEDEEELLAIFMDLQNGVFTTIEWDAIASHITSELGDGFWYGIPTTQPEFETYQAFGIKEIKVV